MSTRKKQNLKTVLIAMLLSCGIFVVTASYATSVLIHLGTTDPNMIKWEKGGANGDVYFNPAIAHSNTFPCPTDKGDGKHYIRYKPVPDSRVKYVIDHYYVAKNQVPWNDRPVLWSCYPRFHKRVCLQIPNYESGGITCNFSNDHIGPQIPCWAFYVVPGQKVVPGQHYTWHDAICASGNKRDERKEVLYIDDKIIQNAPLLDGEKNVFINLTKGKYLKTQGFIFGDLYNAKISITTKNPGYISSNDL